MDVIESGIAHIRAMQSGDGGFSSLSSANPENFADAVSYFTTFFTSQILLCLAGVTGVPRATRTVWMPEIKDIRRKAAEFLLRQKQPGGSFNYWAATAKEQETMPYPDDIDDTFTALAALARYDRTIIDARFLASIGKILPALEISPGGPYRTWLVGEQAAPVWKDVDIAANSAVGYFLSLIDIRLPNLDAFIADSIQAGTLTSPYYPSSIPVAYFISRFYQGECTAQLGKLLVEHARHQQSISPNTLNLAITISALINLGLDAEEFIRDFEIETSPQSDIVWRPYAFCIDPSRDGEKYYGGSSALTAAFCIEALAKYKVVCESRRQESIGGLPEANMNEDHSRERKRESERGIFYEKVCSDARRVCKDLQPDLRDIALRQIDTTANEKIILLVYDFHRTLAEKGMAISGNISTNISADIMEQLALANLYGWIAYTIYDDFLDDEGDSSLLSCANFFARELSRIYTSLETTIPGIEKLFVRAMNTIDGANAWEQAHCRFGVEKNWGDGSLPEFGVYVNLADRSIGHAMGPLAVLLALGYAADSDVYQNFALCFRHYLIARQLHDDAHDWAEDLQRGRINSVSAMIIAEFAKSFGVGANIIKRSQENIIDSIPRLRIFFWKTMIARVVAKICEHIAASRAAIGKCESFAPALPSFMETLLVPLERSAQQTLKERHEALVFLDAYGNGARRPQNSPTNG